jgi:hypothetical protein
MMVGGVVTHSVTLRELHPAPLHYGDYVTHPAAATEPDVKPFAGSFEGTYDKKIKFNFRRGAYELVS